MGIFDGCLLACDIDGTLISGELLPQRNIEKIEYFVSEGGSFSLATGRTLSALSMITSKIRDISPSVLSNGCVIYDFQKRRPLFQKTLPPHSLYMVKDALEGSDVGIEMHAAERIFVPRRSAESDLHEAYELMTAEFADFSEAKNNDINKIIYFTQSEEQAAKLESMSKKYGDECTFYRTCSYINGVKQNYFEQLPKGVSKAETLGMLCEISKIKKGGFFAIGDYYNDVAMLKAADISAVPAGSPDDIKAIAATVTGGVTGGAVADFIEYLEERLKNGQANQT